MKDRANLLRCLALEFDERLLRVERQMGRDNEVGHFTNRGGTCCGWFGFEDVETGATESPAAECGDDRLVTSPPRDVFTSTAPGRMVARR